MRQLQIQFLIQFFEYVRLEKPNSVIRGCCFKFQQTVKSARVAHLMSIRVKSPKGQILLLLIQVQLDLVHITVDECEVRGWLY